ncbi:MAG TPA: hypothetical protein VK202_02385, partial [Bacteroidia bacterium]|nr:hypothetical protein [Bacteroidia bacterium]
DSLLYINDVSTDFFTFSANNDKVFYIKSIKKNTGDLILVEYDIPASKAEEKSFHISGDYLKDIEQNLHSFSIEQNRIVFLTQEHVYEFIESSKNIYKINRDISLQARHTVRYLHIETYNGRIWIGRYNKMIQNKSPFFEWLFIDSNSTTFNTLYKQYDDIGKSLISPQKSYATLNKNILAYISPVDSKIRIMYENSGKVNEEIIDFAPKGWHPFKRDIIKSIEIEYERKPNYKLLDSIAYLETKVYSSISHIALLDTNRILISYVINDTLKSQSNNFYSVTSDFYVDIWSKKGSKWQPELSQARDYPMTSKYNSDSLISKQNFELLSAFSFSIRGKKNRLMSFRTDGYPLFKWGDSWSDFYNKQRNGRSSGQVKPVLLIYKYLGGATN